jgi:uncharacterized protein YdeI (YjbR/CyaY-like superfamily)
MAEDHPTFFPEPRDFRAWLQENHESAEELWVAYYKKATKRQSVTWEETVDEALCFGWIDGVRKSRDDESYVVRFSPRRPKSVWSQRNIEQVERLIEADRMRPAGLAAFAYKDEHPDSGYRTADAAKLTDEMIEQFQSNAQAWDFYQEQPPGYRRQTARWVTSAKREETRQRRLAALIDDSSNGLRIKQLRRS